jgi:RHS repeat-associated protein
LQAPREQAPQRGPLEVTAAHAQVVEALVEGGPLTPGGATVTDRWVMAGRVIYDAKGRPVQQFEPCFVEGAAWSPDDLVAHGVASTLHYDAAGRVHRVDMPDGTHARTVFSTWRIEQWDTNDTVLDSDWLNRTDIDAAAKEASQRVARTPLILDMDALGRARRLERVRRDHEWNPETGYTQFDRPLLTDVSHVETVTLDIEGRALACTDARGNTVYSATYSVSALPLAVTSKDTGRSWALFRADGRPWLSWTGVETAAASESAAPRYRTRMTYDALHRPIARFLQTNDARDGEDDIIETVREWSIYGERATDAADDNRLGAAWRAFDAAGMVESTGFTFAGQPLGSVRRLTSGWVGQPDWTTALQALSTSVSAAQTEADTLLETTAYATAMTWDAMGRPVTTTSPAESGRPPSTTTFGYDRGGRWKSAALTLRGASTSTTVVDDVQYNARGQRTRIVHGSGVTTTSTYDPFSFRLTRQHAVRDPSGTPVSLQDLLYTYDAAGTVVRLEDDAQQSVWFDNAVVDAVWTYGHDDLGRMVWATGREHAQPAGPAPWGEPHARQALPNPGPTAMHAYSETYAYDAAGNLLEHEHTVPSNSAASRTRTYTYETENHRMATAKFEGDLSPRTVAHDSLGRMTSLPGVDFAEWDDANNLVFTKTSSGASLRVYYVYDAGGQRVRKVVEENLLGTWTRTKETRYLGGFELQLKFVGGSLNHERETLHVMDDTRRVALIETDTVDDGDPVTTPTPLLRYQFDNHLRSACVETNASGEVISYEEFHPYGTTAYHAGLGLLDANPKRYRYSGKERDAESGLYYYGARYLAPWLCRWVSADPAGFVDGVNVYAFVRGRPSTGWDEDGRQQSAAPVEKDSQAYLTGFEVGSASLDPVRSQYDPLLERARNSDGRIYIVGQASPTGTDSYNIQLSSERAMAVYDELVKDGIDPARLAVMSEGENAARARGVPDGQEDVYARQVVVHFGSAPTSSEPSESYVRDQSDVGGPDEVAEPSSPEPNAAPINNGASFNVYGSGEAALVGATTSQSLSTMIRLTVNDNGDTQFRLSLGFAVQGFGALGVGAVSSFGAGAFISDTFDGAAQMWDTNGVSLVTGVNGAPTAWGGGFNLPGPSAGATLVSTGTEPTNVFSLSIVWPRGQYPMLRFTGPTMEGLIDADGPLQ